MSPAAQRNVVVPMTEPSLQNENDSAVRSSGEADETTAERPAFADRSVRYRNALTIPLEVVGFWTAVVLPFLYVPLLTTGISTQGELLTFVGLVALNAAALLAGHDHRRG